MIGGIYGGLFTASEAAAVMAFYVMIAEVLIYKDVSWRKLPGIARESMILVGAILIVLGCALGLTSYMIDADIPGRIFAFLHEQYRGQRSGLEGLSRQINGVAEVVEPTGLLPFNAPCV